MCTILIETTLSGFQSVIGWFLHLSLTFGIFFASQIHRKSLMKILQCSICSFPHFQFAAYVPSGKRACF